MSPRSVDREKKRREIAAAAMAVFAEQGFEAASMREVAEMAGIGKGTIYEYFRSKEELIAASIKVWMEDIITELEALVSSIGDPEVKLRTYINAMVDGFLNDERVPRLILSIFQFCMTRLHDTAFGEMLQSIFLTGVDSITGILAEGMDQGVFNLGEQREARIIAVNLAAFLDGLCIDYLVTGRSFDLREQVDHYMRYLLEEGLIG
jgi:AcrR family transcriptional regulator